jgi:hypothetical protein
MWTQQGFAVISEVRAEGADGWMPFVHAFVPSLLLADDAETDVRALPESHRVGLRVVPATLSVEC